MCASLTQARPAGSRLALGAGKKQERTALGALADQTDAPLGQLEKKERPEGVRPGGTYVKPLGAARSSYGDLGVENVLAGRKGPSVSLRALSG
jgi:hypothetical protein